MTDVDVMVVGGGPAGLSAALILGRSRRTVLVADAGEPRNAPADGVHNLLSRDGTPPAQLRAAGRADVARYGVEIVDAEAVGAVRDGDRFAVTLAGGRTVRARRLIVTTGLVDELPAVDGVRERWGRDVLHCPFCHGWEVRDEPVGILATGPAAVHQALLFRRLTDDVVVFAHTARDLVAEAATTLTACGITVVDGEVAGLEIDGDRLTGVRLASGAVVARRALVVAPRFVARGALLADLGVPTVAHPMGGEHVETDAMGRTAVAGVFAAGNVTDLMAQVVVAMAAGSTAGTAAHADLLDEDTRAAVARHTELTRAG